MRGFVSTTVLLLALVSGVSSFVLPAPCARIEQGGLHTGSSAETQTRAGTPRTMASAWTRRVNVDRPSHEATTGRAVLAAAPRGGGEDGGEELEEKAGIEPKCELLHPVGVFGDICV